MKEFRVAKCLVDGKVNEYAIFADGSRKKIIQTDKKYGKYFEVDNELNTDCKSSLRFSYSGRIRDAVEMIRNGDCISSMKFIGRIDKVLYFLDRKTGEELRRKSLEGWKDTKFGWAIECGNKNSFLEYSMLNKKNERISVFDKDRNPMIFDTKESADEYVEYLIERSKYYAKRLVNNLCGITDEKERDKIIDNAIDEIENDTKTKFSIISDFTFDMLTGDCKLKSFECNLDKMGYEIVQCII
jgi:hypothetical protein